MQFNYTQSSLTIWLNHLLKTCKKTLKKKNKSKVSLQQKKLMYLRFQMPPQLLLLKNQQKLMSRLMQLKMLQLKLNLLFKLKQLTKQKKLMKFQWTKQQLRHTHLLLQTQLKILNLLLQSSTMKLSRKNQKKKLMKCSALTQWDQWFKTKLKTSKINQSKLPKIKTNE